jgi:hypothetical protein
MNIKIVRLGLAAVAAAALVVIGIVLLAGRGTGAQLTPSSALAQAPGLTQPVALAKAGWVGPTTFTSRRASTSSCAASSQDESSETGRCRARLPLRPTHRRVKCPL